MSFDQATLQALLPTYLRLRDAEAGGALGELTGVFAELFGVIEEDLEQSCDNLFIETCAPWVVAYIGDLVQSRPLTDTRRVTLGSVLGQLGDDLTGPLALPDIGLRARADVAKTIYYRRRKATLPMLEQLAADVTGYATHVREFMMTLAWTQCVRNHIRSDSFFAPDLRAPQLIDRRNGPFDAAPHVVDVRPPSQFDGWHNIRKIGFFIWRLKSTGLDQTRARPVGPANEWRFHVSPLGQQAPLFARWRANADATIPTAENLQPGPIRPGAFYDDLVTFASATPAPATPQYYGHFGTAPAGALPEAPGASLFIVVNGVPVPPASLQCMNLATWRLPPPDKVGVDVARGRLVVGTDWPPPLAVTVSSFGGFPAHLGGGGYSRQNWLVRHENPHQRIFTVQQSGTVVGAFTTIGAAITAAAGTAHAVISILDSATYSETLSVTLGASSTLAIEAADGERPHLLLGGALKIDGPSDCMFTLSGLLIEGSVEIDGALGHVRILHSTLVPGLGLDQNSQPAKPGTPSLSAASGMPLTIDLAFSISGPLRVAPAQGTRIRILDSIVDGTGTAAIAGATGAPSAGPSAWIERSTLFGPCLLTQLVSATDTIFLDTLTVERRQTGCVRFSFVPAGSSSPRRYRCQPDREIARLVDIASNGGAVKLTAAQLSAIDDDAALRIAPSFTERRYGQPAYGQLALTCPREIGEGAEDGSEMGVYCHLKQAQRMKNLALRLEEYLPFGREAGIVFVT